MLRGTFKNVVRYANWPKQNQVIKLDKTYYPKGIFFSNNDNFVTVIGATELMIIETKTGKVTFKMKLPNWKFVEDIEVFGHPITEGHCDHDHDTETI